MLLSVRHFVPHNTLAVTILLIESSKHCKIYNEESGDDEIFLRIGQLHGMESNHVC